MKRQGRISIVCATIVLLAVASMARAQDMPPQYKEVLNVLVRKGEFKDNVLKVNIPRNDLAVAVAGMPTPTAFGFGGWIAMTKGMQGHEVMMGDLVLLQEEVNPVMSALLANGLQVTALHNHFFWDEPRIFYMHVHGSGTSADLAREIKPALDLIGHVKSSEVTTKEGTGDSKAQSTVQGATNSLSTKDLDRIIGHPGEMNGPVYKVVVGRDDINLVEMGARVNSRMGLNTWAAIVGTDAAAQIAGDVAMRENEVNNVLKALRKNDLDVVAIHQHMFGTKPNIIFLHYWGKGEATRLATGFRAALDELGKQESVDH
jgi:hypothetical protein